MNFKVTGLSAKFKQMVINVTISVNRLVVYCTPKRVLKHFREGTYEDNQTKDHPTKGYMSWKQTRGWMLRALACDCGHYDSQYLNTTPLADTFLEIYDCVRNGMKRPLSRDEILAEFAKWQSNNE